MQDGWIGLAWLAVPWYPVAVHHAGWVDWENQQLHLVSMLCFPSDASLTLPKVLAALRTVDMERLGDVLRVPSPKWDEVEQQSASVEERREGLVKYYMDTSPYASWEDLGGGLLYEGEDAALEEVKVHIKPTQGEYCVSIDMCLHGFKQQNRHPQY